MQPSGRRRRGAACAAPRRQLSWGLFLYSTCQQGESTRPGECQSPVRSAFRVSHPLDGFLLPKPTRPCFVPGALMRFALRGVPPATSRAPLGVVAPLPFLSTRSNSAEASRSTREPPRLRSFALVTGPFPALPISHGRRADTPMGSCLSGAFPPTAEARRPKPGWAQPLRLSKRAGRRSGKLATQALRPCQPQDWLALSRPPERSREGCRPL